MATAADIKYDVTCGAYEEGKKVKVLYKVGDQVDRINFEWIPQPSEDNSVEHVARMTTLDSNRGHMSEPIPDDIYKKLGNPKKKRKNEYCQVKMSREDEVKVAQYFNKSPN